MNNSKNKQKEKAFASINLKSFLTVIGLLVGILVLAGLITNWIPQGRYEYTPDGKIIPDTFVQGQTSGIAFWRVLTAPVRVFFVGDNLTVIMISLFLLIMSGTFNVMEKTNGVKVLLKRSMNAFSNKRKLVVLIIIFFFMLFGSFFGMFEELVALLPIVILFTLSLGYDTMTGLGVCMLSACFGFAAAITNPFSVGLVSEMAGTTILDGVWLRIVFFVLVFAVLTTFIMLYVRKIEKNPAKSYTYDLDREKLKNMNFDSEKIENENKIFKTYAIFFSIELVILVLIATVSAISSLAIPILGVSFLVGGVVCGLVIFERKKDTAKYFIQGAIGMLPAVLMLMIASSIKLVLTESNIIDTIMHSVISVLSKQNKFVCIVLIYLLILILQVFISSASAKIMLIMPIVLPICTAIGISPSLVILTYCMADGFTDMILPTNPILLVGLSMANVSYGKWIKWTWLLQIIMFALTLLILLFAVSIGYGL